MIFLNSNGYRLAIATINLMIALLIVRYFVHFLTSGENCEKNIKNVKKKQHFFKKWNMKNLLHRKVANKPTEEL